MKKTVNRLCWIATILGLGIYETYSLINKKPDDTLSEAIWEDIPTRPYIPFMAGFLCGHFFWQREKEYTIKVNDEDTVKLNVKE